MTHPSAQGVFCEHRFLYSNVRMSIMPPTDLTPTRVSSKMGHFPLGQL
jgi:hypothetical protein